VEANARDDLAIGAGAAEVLVLPTNEEAVIAKAARGLWREGAPAA
jgi:acetate kinase